MNDYSIDFHRQVGAGAVAQGIDQLIILADPAEAAAMAEGASAMFKASRAVGLDRVVEALR
jgi:UDP-N-acetylmuramoyl-tripeptide--D-alanyl-D-alanine ligase